jgi:hypothetical protein
VAAVFIQRVLAERHDRPVEVDAAELPRQLPVDRSSPLGLLVGELPLTVERPGIVPDFR